MRVLDTKGTTYAIAVRRRAGGGADEFAEVPHGCCEHAESRAKRTINET
jgi:hypothetical protein